MLSMEWDKASLSRFYQKIDKMVLRIADGTKKGVKQATTESKDFALGKKIGSKDDNLILTEVKAKNGLTIGRIYTNFNYAPFLEYGTGTYAEMPHIGTTKTFIKSGFSYWLLPIDKVDKKLHNPIITIKEQEFYIMFSQESNPFMRPTALYRRQPNVKVIKQSIKRGIKEVI